MSEEFNSELFNYLENLDEIDLFNRDLSRPQSEEEIFSIGTKSSSGKVTENANTNFHLALDAAGIVNPAADVANALWYAAEGQFGMAGLSVASILPITDFLKGIYKGYKNLDAIPTQTLYRGVRNIDNPEALIEGGQVVGNWGVTGKNVTAIETIKEGSLKGMKEVDSGFTKEGLPWFAFMHESVDVKNLLFTTTKKSEALAYVKGHDGLLLEFDVPIDYINSLGHHALGGKFSELTTKAGKLAGGWGSKEAKELMNEIYPSVNFVEGLPVETLRKISTVVGK